MTDANASPPTIHADTHLRSVVKALTYRVVGLFMTFGVAWAVTRRLDLAASIGVADTAVKVFAFYFHERMWLKIHFGRRRSPEYQI